MTFMQRVLKIEIEADVDNESIKFIFEHMVYGNDHRDYARSWDWVKKHPQIHSWVDGKYVLIIIPNLRELVRDEEALKNTHPVVEGGPYVERAVQAAKIAQIRWINTSIDMRQEILFNLYKFMQLKSTLFRQLCSLDEREFELVLEYFNFGADLTIDKWNAVGTVLIKLSSEIPIWVIALHVAASLSSGCSVILVPPPKACFFTFVLAETSREAGLPKGLLNVVPGRKGVYQQFLNTNIDKVIYNGHLQPNDFVGFKLPQYVAVLTPNHMTSVIFESGDFEAAINKVFAETWRVVPKSFFGVDTIIVQESIYPIFLRALMQKIRNTTINFSENDLLAKTLSNASRNGIKVIRHPDDYYKFVPFVVSQRHMDFGEIPVVTLMTFKTTDNAIEIANNGPYCMGTSLWTTNYAQAKQVSSHLESSIIWINTHGIIDATITFEPSHKSGVGCFGGLEGVLENRTMIPTEGPNEIERRYRPKIRMDADNIQGMLRSSVEAFHKWKYDKNRKLYLKSIIESMNSEYLNHYTFDLKVWSNMGLSYELLKGCKLPDMQALQTKRPLGVIVVVILDAADARECFTAFVSAAIAFGNVVIAVMNPCVSFRVGPVVKIFRKILPEGVLHTVEGIRNASYLATLREVNTVVACTDDHEYAQFAQDLKHTATVNFKRFWIQPAVERSMSEFPKRFLKEQTIFLPRGANFL